MGRGAEPPSSQAHPNPSTANAVPELHSQQPLAGRLLPQPRRRCCLGSGTGPAPASPPGAAAAPAGVTPGSTPPAAAGKMGSELQKKLLARCQAALMRTARLALIDAASRPRAPRPGSPRLPRAAGALQSLTAPLLSTCCSLKCHLSLITCRGTSVQSLRF